VTQKTVFTGEQVPSAITRREFVGAAVLVTSLLTLPMPSRAESAQTRSRALAFAASPQPVISFHMDQPYVDYTGTAEPYVPPLGARSAQTLADLDDAARACVMGF
jgi:hypothetical protein